MSLQKRHQHRLDCFCLWMAVVLIMACWIPSSSAFGDIFVMNSSKIEKDCVLFCDTSDEVDQLFNADCQRGCRFFDTFNTVSMFTKFDDSAALESCHQSCSEAYDHEIDKKTACSKGCTDAQREYNRVYSMSIDWLQDLKSNMTFFQTLLDVTGAIVNPKSFVEDIPFPRKVGKNINRPPVRNVNPPIKYEPQNINIKKNVLKEDNYQGRKQQSTTVPDWIAQSAFILFTLGVIMLLGVCCYCCIFAHLLRRKRKNEIDSESPPSYEQLVRNSYIIVQPSLLNDYHLLKGDKHEESCTININPEDTGVMDTISSSPSEVFRSDNDDEVRLPLRCEMET
uniref:Transmembrane protein 59 n=1 Tax=Daphnia galeata TaxID=27404 RepID=A0A8J2RI46_9CRUS|nr:unnamed protein product [Daphnia galeata]